MFPSQSYCNAWNARFAGSPALYTKDSRGYLCGVLLFYRVKTHRIVWAIAHGMWPKDTIDHINGDSTDNRPCNLRDVSQLDNNRNRPLPKNNTSGVHGVSMMKCNGKWRATIKAGGKHLHLGCFNTITAAAAARKAAEVKYGFHENHGRKA